MDSYITIYKRASWLLKSVGDRVEAGEVIGYVEKDGETDSGRRPDQFVFELWRDGQPLDPERYVYF